jgi:hypothetical protein
MKASNGLSHNTVLESDNYSSEIITIAVFL